MQNNKELAHTLDLIAEQNLSEAIDALKAFASAHPELAVEGPLHEIDNDYKLMFDYWSRGFKDDHLERVYRDMLKRLWRLASDTSLRYAVGHSSFLGAVYSRVRAGARDHSAETLRRSLEGFVSDAAMLELEPEPTRSRRKEEIFRAHQQFINDVFDYLWTSPQLSDGTTDELAGILTSPTVDANDQQLMVSALSLGAMNLFDINKLRLLAEVYRRSTDEQVRQRALVGWAMALGDKGRSVFAEERDMAADITSDPSARKELVELQIQMLYCLSAESDTRKIQHEIMPDLLKRNGFSITPNGIEEKDGESLEDIIHPEAAERDMEKMEESFRKMVEMQKAGSDIYFGGFSQMKRFPFFDSVSNWFAPFYLDHPAISGICNEPGYGQMVRNIIDHLPFCDSDKYSFAIAFKQVADKLPPNIREMLSGGHIAGMEEQAAERDSPAYQRRIYLQDLYRFFRLFPSRQFLYNPFDGGDAHRRPNYLFFANAIFKGTALEENFTEIASCLAKRGLFAETLAVLANTGGNARTYRHCMISGNVLLRHPEAAAPGAWPAASACFAEALRMKPDDAKALSGYARATFYEGDYAKSLETYARLAAQQPGNKGYTLNKCVCLVNMNRSEEALGDLYKLSYESPDDTRVGRVMARALMCTGKHDKASKEYSRLCSSADCAPDDVANSALNEWLAGNKQAAAGQFAKYIKLLHGDVGLGECRKAFATDVTEKETALLEANGVTPTEAHLMADLVCSFILRTM